MTSNVVLSKIQRQILAALLEIGPGEITRDRLMDRVGEFVSDRALRGLHRAGYVGVAGIATRRWWLTESGRLRAQMEASS